MNTLKEKNKAISTILSFALIPLSGFATDIYLPSFPAMTHFFSVGHAEIQLSLVAFIISSGVSQLFVGSLLDSFGRYRISLAALVVFALSCFVVAASHNIFLVLAMRVVQGIAIALIVVGKRAFFVDVYAGEKLKKYTSLFSITWATAPIAAPFIGGFLQDYFGWQSNFYFLGLYALVVIAFEIVFGGETLQKSHPFHLRSVVNAYATKLSTVDFALSIVILGLCFSMVMVYNMASPFIIEQTFHQSAVVTGNCALLSGAAIMIGGLLSRSMIAKPLSEKLKVVGPALLILSLAMVVVLNYFPTMYLVVAFVVLLHTVSGFTFNSFYAYCFGRFNTHAGLVSGLTGGGVYMVTSLISYTLVHNMNLKSLVVLGIAYFIITVAIAIFFVFFNMAKNGATTKMYQAGLAPSFEKKLE